MYALVDGNNFYVSCERAFRPALKTRPVVVLSNNDGCAISRSNEAKALGIKMGAPWFSCRELAEEHGVVALSANFSLYGDMSNRMMGIAAGLGPGQEIYSIDESFVDMTGIRGDLVKRGQEMRLRILQWTGIPTGIGIGPTKTLAKLANFVAKSADRKPGSFPADLARVCNLAALPTSDFDAVLAATNVDEVWGIGRRIAAQLNAEGITNVHQLVQIDPATVRRRWSVVLERTVRELQGQQCIALEDQPPAKKEIAYTRSFGEPIEDLHNLIQAVTEFASGAAAKLRAQAGLAGKIYVFVHTSPFRKNDRQYSNGITVPLRRPTSDSGLLVTAAVLGLRTIYREGFRFVKAGVMLVDLQGADGHSRSQQVELDLDQAPEGRATLMNAVDTLNDRFGRGTVLLASAGLEGKDRMWTMRQSLLTPQYTTRWNDIPTAKA
ncbi:MAG: Y-family DNA polymerase [Polaromonas sp.]|nr:Y-family DNA polymerase [Polaromonas sp.]